MNWYINFVGIDGVNNGGNRVYLFYILVIVFFILVGLEWIVEIGVILWGIDFYNYFEVFVCNGFNGFIVCDISMGVVKEIKIIDLFFVLVFVKVIVNLCIEGVYFVFGLSF